MTYAIVFFTGFCMSAFLERFLSVKRNRPKPDVFKDLDRMDV